MQSKKSTEQLTIPIPIPKGETNIPKGFISGAQYIASMKSTTPAKKEEFRLKTF
jgi:hypothetical protein